VRNEVRAPYDMPEGESTHIAFIGTSMFQIVISRPPLGRRLSGKRYADVDRRSRRATRHEVPPERRASPETRQVVVDPRGSNP
jgi:hypothetical protein